MTKFLITFFLIIGIVNYANAQTSIKFQVDLHAQIKDSTFVPSEDRIEISGNLLPFSKIRTIQMLQTVENDSVYATNIHFPSLVNNKLLRYFYVIKKGSSKEIQENGDHLLELKRQKETLAPTPFDVFVQ